MRTTWKRTLAGLALFGTAGFAALGLAQSPTPNSTPPEIPLVEAPVPLPPVSLRQPIPPKPMSEKQDPSVSLDWSGPPVVKVNQTSEYSLAVKNTSAQQLQKIVVQVKTTSSAVIQSTVPDVKPIDGVYLFDIGTLPSGGSQTLKFQVKQTAKGDLGCQAWVTFTGTSAMTAQVKEPKLTVDIKAPARVVLGEKFTVEYAVSNTGDIEADSVRLNLDRIKNPEVLPPALSLKPGESRRLTAEFLATEPASVEYIAMAEGAEGLSASAKATVQVLVPKIEVAINGPADRMIGKKAEYLVQVRNCGDVVLTGVIVRESLPAGFRVQATSNQPVHADDSLTWSLGDLAVGEVKKFTFEGIPTVPGTLPFLATAEGSRGTKAAHNINTAIDGIPALRMEMLDTVDPVEKGGETTYEIRVVNTGSKADADIRIWCVLPKQFELVSVSGPTKEQNRAPVDPKLGAVQLIEFDPIAELAPRTEAVFKVKVKAIGTGDARFKASLTSKHLNSPVVKEESTRVYGD